MIQFIQLYIFSDIHASISATCVLRFAALRVLLRILTMLQYRFRTDTEAAYL